MSTALTPVPSSAVATIKSTIDISDRARLTSFGDRAQRNVSEFADKVLAQTRNKDLGDTGKLLSEVLAKARELDPASIRDDNMLTRMFSTMEARVRRFAERFEVVAGQIDRVGIELDRHKDTLRRDIALLDELYEETRGAVTDLDAHITAGKEFAEQFRANKLQDLKREADGKSGTADGLLAAQAYQDAGQALERLEKRVFYLQQARQVGIQQLPQIRVVQAADETLIENLQATAELAIPVWKQKMILLLGLNRQKSALDLQKSVTAATNEMMKQASDMMKQQTIEIEQQSQKGIIDIETLEKTNRDLIDTVTSVLKIQEDGRLKRAEVEGQMQQLTQDLRTALSRP